MPGISTLSRGAIDAARFARQHGVSYRAIARELNTSSGAVVRALAKIVDVTREADEFKPALATSVRPPRATNGPYAWSLETIRAARDAQLRGEFRQPVRLAEALRTDGALFTAYLNRIAPQSAVQAQLVPCKGTRGRATASKAARSAIVSRDTLGGIHGTLANHGIAIGYNDHEPNEDGTRIDMRLSEWPLEFVRWNASREVLETQIEGGPSVDIVHGNGKWTIFRKFKVKPWAQSACILPAALVWGAHANGLKDWAGSSASHGLARMFGELPPGVALQKEAGKLSPDAAAFLQMMLDVVSGEAAAGIRPAGSKTDWVANNSTAWQIFKELFETMDKSATRIYLGTDASLGSVGGAPGVDISELFGVATTIIQGDFQAIEEGLHTGLYIPWTAINDGDSRYAPRLEYQLPDVDSEKKSAERAGKLDRLLNAIKRMREEKLDVTQDTVDQLAKDFDVSPAPKLAAAEVETSTITLAPTDFAAVTRVAEARASGGLAPVGDAKIDGMFLPQFKAYLESSGAASGEATAPATGATGAPPTTPAAPVPP